MSKRRIVVTGIGAISPIGNTVDETWANILKGVSGIDTIKSFDASVYSAQIAAEIKDYDPLNYFEKKEVGKLDPYTQYAIIAAREAVKDAGLKPGNYEPERVGVITGAGIGGMLSFEEEARKLVEKGPKRISPFFIPKMISNIAAAYIAIEFNFKGINFNCVSACASANHALGTALRSLQYGDIDIAVAGGAEAAVTPLSIAGFCAMRALSTRNDDPKTASRPFDAGRDGFVMAEGSGMLVLEELEHAKKRGAKIYAEIVGYGATDDAYHITAPAENGEGGARAMQMAIKDAGIQPNDIQYLNAHGTSTPLNDKNETTAIKTVFGDYAYKLAVNSSKSMFGHTLGAAAALEGIVCIKSIQNKIVHQTINYETPDPDCDLDYVTDKSRNVDIEYALSNSLGFGGHNGVLIFKKW
ncbi:MAG: beta-ketoacyl-ACP synthase II [Candidatus Cloacimonadales bacterium]|jgi:3-oxoacyl-[acyl-carrier-protein] synthase II|nr:beta-ketoacyl-ACP synthase II [Candidatus Cloacimonadota bacterium]MDD2649981.1 beta-ketoacyl-ACP synthase II [Candidatus Cloacimonadota bacterium]MDX9976499.1 beta-ketoacyl-ACP synthase II [Candidatus Cloacimonadales bacterium]